ncbi:MAG: DoxX family protein [SAR324 cluster bacterium]|jgi:putative oxidoreductase|nr:DoxX family protein [Candidatus Neomarinimicrobiota bacterium]MDP7500090.1 DoxX family protein [SAR324 cluster bacterium]|tara:strand:- start:127 stop:588 length:462 start_codon:yes stop_codon:yes gene_type:complete
MKTFFQTNEEWSYLILRVMLGIVIFPHGAQKLLGWFGGHGFDGTMEFFTGKLGVPMVIAFMIIIGESLGSLGLIAGFMTRLCAVGVLCIMSGAIVMAHWSNGFFMNWFGNQEGEGFEYHLLAIGICLPLILYGGGKLSVDGCISGRFFKKLNA